MTISTTQMMPNVKIFLNTYLKIPPKIRIVQWYYDS